MSASESSDPLAQCRVTCRTASSEFTHVRAGAVEGECVCYRPFEAPADTAEVLPGVRRYACVATNVDMPLTSDAGMRYVAECRALPKAEESAQYATDVANGGWTTAEAREALASGAWKLMSHDDYLCVGDRCAVRAALQANVTSAAPAATTPEVGTAVPMGAVADVGGTAAASVGDGVATAAVPAAAPPPPVVEMAPPASASPPTSTSHAERQAHAARALTMMMRTPHQSSGFQYVPPAPHQPPAGTEASTPATTGNGTNSLTALQPA